jgi:hypothetical protein
MCAHRVHILRRMSSPSVVRLGGHEKTDPGYRVRLPWAERRAAYREREASLLAHHGWRHIIMMNR